MQSHIRKVCVCLAVTCHLRFWQNDQGLLRATAVTRGWNRYQNKSQHRKWTLEKKILLPLQQGFEPAIFRSRVRRSNHWAIPAPRKWNQTDKHSVFHRASLVPVFSFGENNLFTQLPNPQGSMLRKLQNFLTRLLGFSPPIFHGRGVFNYTFGLMPYRMPINTVCEHACDFLPIFPWSVHLSFGKKNNQMLILFVFCLFIYIYTVWITWLNRAFFPLFCNLSSVPPKLNLLIQAKDWNASFFSSVLFCSSSIRSSYYHHFD